MNDDMAAGLRKIKQSLVPSATKLAAVTCGIILLNLAIFAAGVGIIVCGIYCGIYLVAPLLK